MSDEQQTLPTEWLPAEVFHPSEFIREEMDARGWSVDDLAQRMGGDINVNRLALDLYFHVGPTDPNLLLGDCSDLERAFDVPAQFWLNLETAWQAWRKAQVS